MAVAARAPRSPVAHVLALLAGCLPWPAARASRLDLAAARGLRLELRNEPEPQEAAESASECTCQFKGLCTCDGALEFMRCIGVACAGGKCKCEDARFSHACKAMGNTCKSIDLKCDGYSASCVNSWGANTNVSWMGPGKRQVSEAKLHNVPAQAFLNPEAAVVYAFMFTIAMLAVVFAMATTSDEVIKMYTWYMIDQTVSVFLAVLYFSATDALLELHEVEQENKMWFAIANTVIIFVAALFVAHMLRKNDTYLGMFCATGAHLVGFTTIHAASHTQRGFFLKFDHHWTWAAVGLIVMGFIFLLVAIASHKLKLAAGIAKDSEYMEKTDGLEQDAMALAFSVVWTMVVRCAITGQHPGNHEHEFHHTPTERLILLIYAIFSVFLAGLIVRICSLPRFQDEEFYWSRRAAGFFATVASMNVAWAWLFWGQWHFFGNIFQGEPLIGNILWAMVATAFCALALIALSRIPTPEMLSAHLEARLEERGEEKSTKIAKKVVKKLKNLAHERKVALTALALIVAFSWEGSFDAAVEDMCEGRSDPHRVKIFCALTMSIILFPVWAFYLRPISGPAAEAIEASGSSSS